MAVSFNYKGDISRKPTLAKELCKKVRKYISLEFLVNSSTSGHYLETFAISEVIKNKRNNLIANPNLSMINNFKVLDNKNKLYPISVIF